MGAKKSTPKDIYFEFNNLQNKNKQNNIYKSKYKFTNRNKLQIFNIYTIKNIKKNIIKIHSNLLLNTEYSNFNIDTSDYYQKTYKIKCEYSSEKEIIFRLDDYKLNLIFLDNENINIHIYFMNQIFNNEIYKLKNNIKGDELIKKYLNNIDFCTYKNLIYSIIGYFDWSYNLIYKDCIFNMNCFDNKIETYLIVPIRLYL